MNLSESIPSTDSVLALVRGELSSARRWWYRVILLVTSVWVAAILSLWVTEPGPLPPRLHVAFAAVIIVGLGWIGVLLWILTRRRCPTAFDRLATSWMATIACCVFLVVSVPTALLRGHPQAALSLGFTGVALLGAALFMLGGAYSLRKRLQRKLAELEGASANDPS